MPYKRVIMMMIDGMREDFNAGEFVHNDFGYPGVKATAIEETMNKYPNNTRYYSV